MSTPVRRIEGAKYFREVFSYSEDLSGFVYENCDFTRADLICARVMGTTFINCSLNHMDAFGAEFIDCTFQDCNFQHTSFAKARFLGCQIRQTSCEVSYSPDNYDSSASAFSKASFTQAQFGPNGATATVLDGLFLSATGFKYGLFDGVRITNCLFYGTSFESCLLRDVKIDCLDLQRSACNYLEIRATHIGRFIAPASKMLEIIGIAAVLEGCDFLVTFGHDQSHRIEALEDDGLLKVFKDGARQSVQYGRYATAINSLVALQILSKHYEWSPIPEHESQIKVTRRLLGKVGLEESVAALLRVIFEQQMAAARTAKLDDVANLLTVLCHHGLQTETIGGLMEAIAGHALATDRWADDLTKAQLNLALERYFRSIYTGRFNVDFCNRTVDLDDIAASVKFSRFIREILDMVGADASGAYALQQGSIIEQVKGLTASHIAKIACIMFILNCEFSFSDSHGYTFEYKSPHATLEKVLDFVVDELGPALLEEWRDERAKLKDDLKRSLPSDQAIEKLQNYTHHHAVVVQAMPQPYDGGARIRQLASL